MRKTLIWWIDDETDRLSSAAQNAIAQPQQSELKRHHADLELKKVKNSVEIDDIIAKLSEMKKQKKRLPDLIVIDQRLDVETERGITQRGSSVAVELRTQAPLVPVVGVTGADLSDFSSLQKEQFIELFLRNSITRRDRIPDLFAIAAGFTKVNEHLRKLNSLSIKTDSIIKLLRTPSEDKNLLRACIPGEFKREWDDETPHSFTRWIWHTLLSRPGFTYDELEIATLLGLKPKGFQELAVKFADCTYKGIFNSSSRQRWWVSSIRTKARALVGATISRPLWEIGREIVGDKQAALFSKCYGRSDRNCTPDVVAYKDQRYDPANRVQALSSDTELIESESPPMGFEQRRVFHGE